MAHVKAIFVGEAGVGKTCIIERATHNWFKPDSSATIGALKTSLTIPGCEITFDIWDTAGQEKYRSIAPFHFSGARVAFLVFDLTQANSFEGLRAFRTLLQQHAPPDCLSVLVGNKSDLADQRQVTIDEGEQFRSEIGAGHYFETSALIGAGITAMFETIAKLPGLVVDSGEKDYIVIEETSSPAQKPQCRC